FAAQFVPNTTGTFAAAPEAAFHCMASASALLRAQQGAMFSSDFQTALQASLKNAAGWLVLHERDWGGAGWGLPLTYEDATCGDVPGQWDAFQDGTCNPKGTVYAYQTGISNMCLVLATAATGDPSYYDKASRSLTAYSQQTFRDTPAMCPTCGHMFYSLSP